MPARGAASPEPSQRLWPDSLLDLLERVHGSPRLDSLGSRYIAGARGLVRARAYALYIFDPDTRRPTRLAQLGGVEPFVTLYEQLAFAYDPLLAHVDQTLQPVHDALLFSQEEWQRQPLRQALAVRRLMRMLVAPLPLQGERIGSLFFTRRPEDPAFSGADLAMAGVLGRHLALAVHNAMNLHEAGERARTAEGALQVMGSALVLTDAQGRVRFANRAADHLLRSPFLPQTVFEGTLRENLRVLGEGRTEAVGRVDVGAGGRQVVLRSRRLPEIDGRVATFLNQQAAPGGPDRFGHLQGLLSAREIQVLELLSEGLQNKEIAVRLSLSTHAVQYHLKRLYSVMKVRSRTELVRKALQE